MCDPPRRALRTRDDTTAYAGRLYDRLSSQFGAANVFMDVDTLRPGVDFVEVPRFHFRAAIRTRV
jgi:hypothetical protein